MTLKNGCHYVYGLLHNVIWAQKEMFFSLRPYFIIFKISLLVISKVRQQALAASQNLLVRHIKATAIPRIINISRRIGVV